jgi:adenylylsulfate kinase
MLALLPNVPSPLRRSIPSAPTIWFTGLSGSGKSTLAKALAAHLDLLSIPCELVDGDEMRRELCSDLGFSARDRDENIRRIAYLAALLNRHGIIAIVAAISPYRAARQKAREKCGDFVEVHIDCSLSTLIARDTKGLYRRALAGELPYFSGVSDPYEPPPQPEIYLNSDSLSEVDCRNLLIAHLESLQIVPSPKPVF